MKRIYLLLLLLVALVVNVSAQRKCNVQIISRLDSSYYTNKTSVEIKNGHTILAEPSGNFNKHKFTFLIKNLGPDTVATTDTVFVSPFVSAGDYYLVGPKNFRGKTAKAGDTIIMVLPVLPLGPSSSAKSGTQNINWCDSVYITGNTANKVSDPTPNDNACATVSLTIWATSVNDITSLEQQSFNVYPNPASSAMNFDFNFGQNSNGSVIVRDILGKAVYQKSLVNVSGKQSMSIDASSFSNGLYFVELTANNVKKTTKAFIQK